LTICPYFAIVISEKINNLLFERKGGIMKKTFLFFAGVMIYLIYGAKNGEITEVFKVVVEIAIICSIGLYILVNFIWKISED
jgi:hypothetical protein